MKVLVAHNRYRSEMPSGEDRVVDQEIALLRAAGHDVEMFERRSDDIAEMPLRKKALVPLQVPWNPVARTALAARLRTNRPDVVHIHNTFPLLSPSILDACFDEAVPTVATLHNYLLACPVATLTRAGLRCTECSVRSPVAAVRHRCYRNSALASMPVALNTAFNRRRWQSRVTRFFCVSESQRRALIDAGVPADRLSVKPHFVPEPGTRRTRPGNFTLFLGRLTEEKGVRLLMTAWDELDLDIPLLLAGDGPLRAEVRDWAANRGGVRCLGLRSPQECRELLADATVLVAPSKVPETFGLVVVEAMAVGVPVVAARIGGYADTVADGVTGVLHQPNDPQSLSAALRLVIGDPGYNRALGESARAAYEARFAPDVGLSALMAGYQCAIGEHLRRNGRHDAEPRARRISSVVTIPPRP